MISKFVNPPDSKGYAKKRGAYLRNALNISEDYYLLQRKWRDKVEHFDEKLDEWSKKAKENRYIIMRDNIGPVSSITAGDLTVANYALRHFDPESMDFFLFGDRFELMPIRDALVEMLDMISSRIQNLENAEYPEKRYGAEFSKEYQIRKTLSPVVPNWGMEWRLTQDMFEIFENEDYPERQKIFDIILLRIGQCFLFGRNALSVKSFFSQIIHILEQSPPPPTITRYWKFERLVSDMKSIIEQRG